MSRAGNRRQRDCRDLDEDRQNVPVFFGGHEQHSHASQGRTGSTIRQNDGSVIPTVYSSQASQATRPNYGAPLASTRTGTDRWCGNGGRGSSYTRSHHTPRTHTTRYLNSAQHHRNNSMLPPPRPFNPRLNNYSGFNPGTYGPEPFIFEANQTQHGRPMAQPVHRQSPQERRKEEHCVRKQNNDWRIGDIVNFDLIKASQHTNPNIVMDPMTGDLKYTDKCHYLVPGKREAVYWEARFGVIIAIHRGDNQLLATVLPIWSYGGDGARYKNLVFALQHLTILNRSEWARIRASHDSANPHVPDTHTLFVDQDDDFLPGQKNSLVVLSKAFTIYLDSRVRGPQAELETESRNMLRDVWQMYNSMASLNQEDLVDFDCSRFPWLRGIVPQSANSLAQIPQPHGEALQQPTPPASNLPEAPTTRTPPVADEANSRKLADGGNSLKRKDAPSAALTPLEKIQKKSFDQHQLREKIAKQISMTVAMLAKLDQDIVATDRDVLAMLLSSPGTCPSSPNETPQIPRADRSQTEPEHETRSKRRMLKKVDADEPVELISLGDNPTIVS